MTAVKKFFCIVLVLTVLTGMTSCASKGFDHKKMARFSEKQDFEAFDDPEDFLKEYNRIILNKRPDEGAYITATKSDARELYDKLLNPVNSLPSCDIEEFTTVSCNNDDRMLMGVLMTFEETKDAEKFYKKFSKKYLSKGDKGEQKGYSYTIYEDEMSKNKTLYWGIYLKGSTVLMVRSICRDTDPDLIDDLCKTYGVIPPSEY